jgi:hypothetical protein
MTGISKDGDWQTPKSIYRTSPSKDTNLTTIRVSVGGEMIDDQDDKIANGYQGDETGILERIEPPEEAERDKDQHESSDPEMTINQEGELISSAVETPHDSWHQVANDDHIRDSDTKTFDGNSSIEDHGGVRIGDLR